MRVDAALREAAGDEPKAGLRRALEHVAQLLAFAEAPDRADALRRFVAEQPAHQFLLALVTRGEHAELRARQHIFQIVELREADLAFGDELRAADVEVVAAAPGEVHELPAGAFLA